VLDWERKHWMADDGGNGHKFFGLSEEQSGKVSLDT
jgi:hypothetical protein